MHLHFLSLIFGLKGDRRTTGEGQGEPEAADSAGRHGTGAVQETGGIQL